MLDNLQVFQKGSVIASRYEVEELLGAGGMGWVLRVRDRHLRGHEVALKLLYPHLLSTEAAFARFRSEVSVTRRLSHPLIVQTFGYGRERDKLPYVSMEFVRGKTLKALIRETGNQQPFEVIERILLQIVEALRFAHSKRVIHRDIKPENALVTSDLVVKLADFGLAQFLREESQFTRTGQIVGTPYYMSPEQMLGEPLAQASDIYSFGILAFELAAGVVPFEGASIPALAEQHLSAPFPQLPRDGAYRPDWFRKLLAACCAKKPQERPASMDEIASAFRSNARQNIEAIITESTPALPGVEHENSRAFWFRRHARLIYASVVTFGLLTVLMLFCQSNVSVTVRVAALVYWAERWTGYELKPIKSMFNISGRYGDSALLYTGDPTLLPALLWAGMDPNTRDPKTGNGCPHNNPCLALIRSGILADKIDLNMKNFAGETPLLMYASTGENESIESLLLAGADPNISDSNGNTPLSFVVERRNKAGAALLLLHGADPNRIPHGQMSPLAVVVQNNDFEMTRQLLAKGADPELPDANGTTALMVSAAQNNYFPEQQQIREALKAAVRRKNMHE